MERGFLKHVHAAATAEAAERRSSSGSPYYVAQRCKAHPESRARRARTPPSGNRVLAGWKRVGRRTEGRGASSSARRNSGGRARVHFLSNLHRPAPVFCACPRSAGGRGAQCLACEVKKKRARGRLAGVGCPAVAAHASRARAQEERLCGKRRQPSEPFVCGAVGSMKRLLLPNRIPAAGQPPLVDAAAVPGHFPGRRGVCVCVCDALPCRVPFFAPFAEVSCLPTVTHSLPPVSAAFG